MKQTLTLVLSSALVLASSFAFAHGTPSASHVRAAPPQAQHSAPAHAAATHSAPAVHAATRTPATHR